MCDAYGEACFSEKKFTNELNIGLPLRGLVEKIVHRVEKHWLTDKENILSAAVSKEGHADSLLGYERTHPYIRRD